MLDRLLRPKSVAVFGGAWAREVLRQLKTFGYDGAVWPVHPERSEMEGFPAYPSLDALPSPPDAAFIGVNRHETIRLVEQLSRRGAGGAVCFASGFAETGADGAALQRELIAAAGEMPLLGPNGYGFINAFDRALLWPDLHGCRPQTRGVAFIAQSSNIAINLTMARRALPIGYVICLGNQAVIGQSQAIEAVAEDERVSVIGLHIEAIADAPAFARAVQFARARGKAVLALRAGRSEGARALAASHTASLAGASAVAAAFLARLGVAEVDTIPEFLEAAKLLHALGPLGPQGLATLSCSGGEAGLIADAAERASVKLTRWSPERVEAIRATVNPLVTVSNPFDYHTFDWGARERLERTFAEVMRSGQAATALVLDWPKSELGPAPGWDIAEEAFSAAARATGAKAIVVATVPECLPEDRAARMIVAGVAPMQGLSEMMAAVRAATAIGAVASLQPFAPLGQEEQNERSAANPLLPSREKVAKGRTRGQLRSASPQPSSTGPSSPLRGPSPARGKGDDLPPPRLLDEAEGKAWLAAFGVSTPEGVVCLARTEALEAAERLSPVAMKAIGEHIAHKTELGAVRLGVATPAAAADAYENLALLSNQILVERMAAGAVAELIVGAARDPALGLHLIIGAGGVLAELIADRAILMLPTTRSEIDAALGSLKVDRLLRGFRGKPAANRDALVEAIARIGDFVASHADTLEELDVNPLIATPDAAIAVDVLMKLREPT